MILPFGDFTLLAHHIPDIRHTSALDVTAPKRRGYTKLGFRVCGTRSGGVRLVRSVDTHNEHGRWCQRSGDVGTTCRQEAEEHEVQSLSWETSNSNYRSRNAFNNHTYITSCPSIAAITAAETVGLDNKPISLISTLYFSPSYNRSYSILHLSVTAPTDFEPKAVRSGKTAGSK